MTRKKFRKAHFAVVCGILSMTMLLPGCQMKKEVDTPKGDSGEESVQTGQILKVQNPKFDLDAITEQYIGCSLEQAMKNGAELEKEGSYTSYEYKSDNRRITLGVARDGSATVVTYEDQNEMAGRQYESGIKEKRIFHVKEDVISCGLRAAYPEEQLDTCSKDEVLAYCKPYAEVLGYDTEKADIEVCAMTLDTLQDVDAEPEYASGAPFPGAEKLSDDDFSKEGVMSRHPWKKEHEAFYVIYHPWMNGIMMDSAYHELEILYVPKYKKIVYMFGMVPWEITGVASEEKLISKEDAIAKVKMQNGISDEKKIEIKGAKLVYSQTIKQLQDEHTLCLCWRVDYRLIDSAMYQGAEACRTLLINAVTGDKCRMWP